MNTYTVSDVSQKNTTDCLWIIYEGNVYDITNFYPHHPGGKALLKYAGKDITSVILHIPSHIIAIQTIKNVLENNLIGKLYNS
ncbi:Cytochrome b5-like heme/steroid binding domain-containing protein [Strongyloides ratti]|uniref:Cytochrome b5-like heme/steroid binding domain-containing protein n=1 Tax=Strongyloides ratti TaxID=34506 RepID=A0A090KVC9_STRRB|nr:Cytochrome b5-like heme/steroid binding domain-containing protein [Strongyloides ratti]CEF59815.1 Cytochrome b5-like heme/steroid binding domain-containing protein [Strongyloides ratti]